MAKALNWQWRYFSPRFFGMENVKPGTRMLFVGNHTLDGGLDAPLLLRALYEQKQVYLRALGDRFHFHVPLWRDMLQRWGVVEGSRENCARLMEEGWPILVFPGGGREVMKNRGEAYQLLWKDRTGFARMAMQYGYDIVPFAAVGADDAYSIHYDANDFRASVLGKWLTRHGLMKKYLRDGEIFMPWVTGIGVTRIPRPERMYFNIGPAISTYAMKDLCSDKSAQWALREQVSTAIYGLMDELFRIRAADQDYSWWRRRLLHRHVAKR